ncbi:ribonuclease VapC43 [Microtetraspora sp. NBRC 13810]|uniref:type II toxin-antitoxin system VapC family toxin n=1 Tax=Microtetraspora sp. NBRC 13810 TaxID=3030990 RepID=UPI00249F9DDA|nr:type II toxin-antitoxin system VapC family toxin [Microtetraspora sp. NBRC 13810]GLW06271.1 ribonuclease VapC43 [Microtetraspora sp. NBRC 13810]
MQLLDVNVLINAHREDADRHKDYLAFVGDLVNGEETYAVSDAVIAGFLRVVTNARIPNPSPLDVALEFAERVRNQPHAVVLHAGRRHWEIFSRLCRETAATGKLVPDAYLAALAIEHGCEFVTCDGDFAKFKGLRSRHPLN